VGMTDEEIRYFAGFPRRKEAPFRLISIGRLLHWKGVHLGIQAFAQFAKACPMSEYWIVNDGPETARLRKLVTTLGIEDKVTFWGRLPALEDVYTKLAECDALVHPALHEAFGNVCLEAMAAGRPVICLDLGGPALQVTPQTGIKVPATTPAQTIRELAEAMTALYQNPEMRLSMGDAARLRVVQNFRWDKKAQEMNEIYQEAATQTLRP